MAQRRRQYIVDQSFQLKYTLLIAFVGGAISLLFTSWMWEAHKTNTEMLNLADSGLKSQVMAADQHLLWLYVGVTLLMMAALGLLGVLITHRVAGPAFVMERYLDVVADGAYPNLRPLRKRDELKGFFASLEKAVESLKARDLSEAERLEAAITTLEGSGADAEVLASLKSIRDRKRQSVAGATTQGV